jgi:Fibronectin type III domain
MRITHLSHPLVRTTTGLLAGAALLLGAGASHAFAAVQDMPVPQNLSAAALDGYTIRVTWRDTNATEEGYSVVQRQGSFDTPAGEPIDFKRASKVDGIDGTGAFTASMLKPGTTYCFKVSAFSSTTGGHTSAYSEAVCATTVAPPQTPANFRGERDTIRTRILLNWGDVSGETYYALSATSHVGQVPQRLAETPAMVGANSTTFIVDGAVSNAVTVAGGVDFELRACNPNGCSAPAKLILP